MIKKNVMLLFFVLAFMGCKQTQDSEVENPIPDVPKIQMEITGFSVGGQAQNPKSLLDGKKQIVVRTNEPILNIALKEKYKNLVGFVKIGGNSQSLNFDSSASASYRFQTLTENVDVNVVITITAKDRQDVVLKFKVMYKAYQKVNIIKISFADKDFTSPFDSLKGKIIDVKKNSTTITLETSSDTQELVATVNDAISSTCDPVRPYIAYLKLSNLSEGDNSISLKVKAKERTEEVFNFTIKYTKPQELPVSIVSITIADKVFSKGSTLETLDNSTVDITNETFDLQVELSEDYAGKKVRVSNGTEFISTKDSNWVGKVATLKCNEEYKDISIKISADNKLPVTYKVKIIRIKNVIEVFQILLADDYKYGKFGEDLGKLLDSSPTTETINVKKAKVNVKVTLEAGESVEKAEVVQEGTTHIPLTFSGTIATTEVTLKEGLNNFTIHFEKTVSSTKINADYKFIFKYVKEAPKFNYIRLKLNDTDKWKADGELENFVSSFVATGDVLACKKEYSLWNTKASLICGIKKDENKFEYAISKESTLPTIWTVFTKKFENINLDETSTYVFMKISIGSDATTVYRLELAPIINPKETGVSKTELEYLDAEGNKLYQEAGLTKKVKIIVKPKNPKIIGISLKEPEIKAFTKITSEGKFKNWYEVEFPITEEIMEVKTINAKYEVKAENGIDKEEYNQEVKLIPTLKDFKLAYTEDFANPVVASFDDTTKTYRFSIDKASVLEKKLYLKIFVAEYYEITSEGIEFTDGTAETIDEQSYIPKAFIISNFENTKTFKLTVKEDSGHGTTEYNVEIK